MRQNKGVVRFSGGDLRGSLADTSLPRLLVGAAFDEATGKLRVSRGKIRKVVYLLRGRPIYVDSNLRNETLGAFLVAQGVIDEAQLSDGVRHARKHGTRLGQALIDLGYTDSATITAGLTAQTQMKIAAMLRWPDGSFTFGPGDDFSGRVPDSPIDVVRLVLGALKRLLQADEIDVDLQSAPRLTGAGEQFAKTIEAVFGPALLQRCETGSPLSQPATIEPALPMAELRLQLTALLTCGLAEVGEPFEAESTPTTTPVEAGAPEAGPLPPLPPLATAPGPPSLQKASVALEPPQIPPALADRNREDTFDALLAVPPTDKPLAAANNGKTFQPQPPDDHAAPLGRTPTFQPSPGGKDPALAPLPAGASTDEIDFEPVTTAGSSGRAMVLGLEDLDPTCGSSPELPPLELEFLQPTSEPASVGEDDSGILALPSLDDIELEERDPEAMASNIAAALAPLQEPLPEASESPSIERSAGEGDDPSRGADSLLVALKQAYENIHEKSYYEVLGVTPSASKSSIEQAYRDLKDRFSSERFSTTSDEAQQCDDLQVRIKQASSVLLDPLSRHAYDERLGSASPQPTESHADNFGAELYFQDGQNRLRTGDVDGAVRAFSQAIDEKQNEPHYHAFFGWALFLQRGRGAAGAQAARPHLQRALEISPESAEVHELAAQVERNVRNHRATAMHLDRALTHGAPRMDLFDQLRDALRTLGDYAELERQYRLMVFRLRTTSPEQTVPLWVDLAYLHHEKLGQPREAAVALEVATKLAPNDPRVQAARASIGAGADTGWKQQEEGFRRRALDNPNDDSPLHDLVSLHKTHSHGEELLTITGLLVGRDSATVEERQVYEQLRPTRLTPATSPIAPLLDQIRREEDDPLIERLIAQLSPVICRCDPITLADLGSDELELLADIGLPNPFADLLVYLCRQLDQPPPELYLSCTVESIIPAPGEHRRLMVSQRILDSKDEPMIVFAVARAFSCITEGRRHAFGRRARVLKNAFVAAYSFCHRKRPPDPEGKLVPYFQALEDLADRAALLELFRQIRGRINLSDWIRAVRCTAARVGLLLSGDSARALALVDDDNTREDLIAFALSPAYARLRKVLGIAQDRE